MIVRTVLILLLLSASLPAQEKKAADNKLRWLPFDSVQKTFPVAPKPLFLYISEKGCAHCDYMDTAVFNRPEIVRFVNENLTAVRVDIYLNTPLKVRDSLMDEMAFRRLLSIVGIPAYYFFDTSGRIIGVLDSEMDLLKFKRMLVFLRGGHFFRTPWEKFLTLPEASEAEVNKNFPEEVSKKKK